ncbi:DUF927 domain-containing protein [Streptomyces albidoflavus]|uniref:DUF927 domain-containing protein n=1 Tax=Streptomyces albidoflavus TaxID=1886 RepID=UPI0033DB6C87
MKKGWWYRQADRTILHQHSADDVPLVVGQVPRVISTITHLTDDGEDIRTEYLVLGKRQRRPRILTEDELDRGTWAAKLGSRRPTGSDEKHAFARLIREEGDAAPVVPARTYYTDEGDLVMPDPDAQTLGYRTLRGTEEEARDAWDEIGAWMSMDGKAALVAGAYMAGPVLDSLDMLAHMVSVHGPGQQGKSTILVVCAACYGDLKPRRQQLMMTWNASKQGITQSLRQRGYLPVALDEHSSSGRTIKESSREISQMVAGAIRAMGTADGSPRESDGFWHSVVLSSSNEPLKFEGQTEDLASRLQEFEAPFFPNRMVLPDGAPAPEGHPGAEHISKRLKRLAKEAGGWPVEWATRKGMYRAPNLTRLRELHLELCARYRPAQGGIAATIAELHMAWVVGAHMLGQAIGAPNLGPVAEAEAAARLAEAIEVSAEANLPDSERLWQALDSLRIEASAFPPIDKLPNVAEEGFRRLRGFTVPEAGEWWVVNPVVQETAVQAGIDNVSAALRALDKLGVHIRGTGKNAQRQLPKAIRYAGLGERMHCFSTRKASEIFASEEEPEEGPEGEFPSGATPGSDPGATGVAPENMPLTSSGATGATGATLSLIDFSTEGEATAWNEATQEGARDGVASRAHAVTMPQAGAAPAVSVPPMPSHAPAPPYPPARPLQPGDTGLDDAWQSLANRAQGRTAGALAFGVLGDGQLLLPNHAPVDVAVPRHVDEVPALMASYGLRTLWVHPSAMPAMGLPSLAERRELGDAQRREAEGLAADARVQPTGPMNPVAHPWVALGSESAVAELHPGGLAAWTTLKLAADGQRKLLALPGYETRFNKPRQAGLGGWGGAETPEVLLDALMVYLLSTVHGPRERPQVVPYYQGPNETGADFAGGPDREDVRCEAIRSLAVPPAAQGLRAVPLMVPQQWYRKLTEAEQAAGGYLHRYDKTAAWLGAYSSTKLGVGEPVHGGEGTHPDPGLAGYWRVADVPGTGPEGLPPLAYREAAEGGYWLTTPSLALLRELYPDWTPHVLESWHWPESKVALSSMYKRISASRVRIVAALEEGRPGAKWAKQVNGRIYQSFRGHLGRREPRKDHKTGAAYDGDVYFRPDWADMLISQATANLYRNLVRFAAEGRTPVSVYVDAATYLSTDPDPAVAKPDSMQLGAKGGSTWTAEGTAPLPDLLEILAHPEDGRLGPHGALNTYLYDRKER